MRCAATGKIRHLDRAAARRVQAQLPYRDKVEPYPCPDCGGFHLGGHHRRRRGDVLAQLDRSEHAQRRK